MSNRTDRQKKNVLAGIRETPHTHAHTEYVKAAAQNDDNKCDAMHNSLFRSKQRYERFANRHIGCQIYRVPAHDAVALYFMQFGIPLLLLLCCCCVAVVVIIFNSIVFYLPFHVVHIIIAHNSNQYYFDYCIYGYANARVFHQFWFSMRDAMHRCKK